jgi:DNA-binding response OmpR family regulator
MADKKRILVADDDPDFRSLVELVLGNEGYEILTAVDGREALRLATSEKFDLILLDVMMPYIDGYHIAYEVSTKMGSKAPPIVIMTSRDTNREKGIAMMSGAHAVMQKPIENAELCRRVAGFLSPAA